MTGTANNNYTALRVDGVKVLRHRINFEIAKQRPIVEKMDIDHIDGNPKNDSWSNLQELSRAAHVAKTTAINPQLGQKLSVSQGMALVATHIDSGDRFLYASGGEAAKHLRLNLGNIWRCLKGGTKRVGRYSFAVDPKYLTEQADLPGEEWRIIPDEVAASHGIQAGMLENIEVSSMGRIQDKRGRRSFGSKRRTDSKDPTDCYMVCKIWCGTKTMAVSVHVLCALAFLGAKPSPKHTVDHFDRRKNNNRCDNLRWCTPVEQGLNKSYNRAVHQIDLDTDRIICTYPTIAAAARALSIHQTGIRNTARGIQMHFSGYGWEFVV